jgi:hypothetical protein
MVNDPSGWLCVADPNWLDYLSSQPDLPSLIYYKGPYRPTTKLPRGAPFVCCCRGETPRRVHLIGMFNGYEVMSRQEAWNRYHRRLGVPSHEQWQMIAVGTDNLISCHELVNYRFIDDPPLLEDIGVVLTNPSSSMGRYLSSTEAQQILDFVNASNAGDVVFPDEIQNLAGLFEGAFTQVYVNRYERNRRSREKCIAYYGSSCTTCGLSFREVYGEIGNNFIHVHHLVPLSTITAEYRVDPIADLRPVCPNCHAMIHRKDPPYSIEEMQQIIENARRWVR